MPCADVSGNAALCKKEVRKQEPAISRVLSWTTIHLGRSSPIASSNLPGSPLRRAVRAKNLLTPLFGLAPGGVYHAAECYHPRGALLPHLFTLAGAPGHRQVALRRCVFCGTFHGLSPSRRYLAPCPMEPGLSSAMAIIHHSGCLAASYFLELHIIAQRRISLVSRTLFAGCIPHFPAGNHREDLEEKKKHQQESGGKACNQDQLGQR